ncbi:Transketolase-like protein 2 [Homalodisca vitripennis]|nr:Transketolase-like protein 2 [Homalodisca vitripennis]
MSSADLKVTQALSWSTWGRLCLNCRSPGGLGEAVISAVAGERDIMVKKLAVPTVPRSGPPKVLLEMFGISAKNIIAAVKEIINK